MLKRLANMFSDFFGSLFGGKKKNQPTTKPSIHDKPPGLTEDSSDVPIDSIMIVDIMDVEIPVSDNDPGPFADDDKENAIENNTTTDSNEPPTDPTQPDDNSDPSPDDDEQPEEPATPPPPAHKPRFMWCLDNGHGKLQAGKRSPKFNLLGEEVQFLEYEFNRDIVKRIMEILDKKGVKYFDVVPDVETVGSFLEERVQRANKHQSTLPKLYISVHANAGPAAVGEWVADSIKGAETWFAHNSTKGKKMAAIFQKHIIAKTGFKDRKLKSTQIKNLYVLVKTVMPAVLTENGFYNNEEEVKQLMRTSVRQKIAEAHVDAIMEIEKNGL